MQLHNGLQQDTREASKKSCKAGRKIQNVNGMAEM